MGWRFLVKPIDSSPPPLTMTFSEGTVVRTDGGEATRLCLKDRLTLVLNEGGFLKKSLVNELILVVALRATTLILLSGCFNSSGFSDVISFFSLLM